MYIGSEYHKQNLLKAAYLSGEKSKEKKVKRVEVYNKSPKRCKACNNPIPYEKKNTNIFCNHSCAAKISNKNRPPRSEESRKKLSNILRAKNIKRKTNSKIKYKNCSQCNKLFITKLQSTRKTCSKKCYKDLASENSRRHPNIGGFKLTKKHGEVYFCKELNKEVFLDSSWEIKYAKYLDLNNIKWIRPKNVFWKDKEEKIRRYTPDFYLIDNKEYIDIKNDYLLSLKSTKDKIKGVEEYNNIKINLLSKQDLVNIKVL